MTRDLFESLSGQDDVEKNMLSDFASRMAARGAEASVKESTVEPAGPGDDPNLKPACNDPKDKARLDLLFRYLASVDPGSKEQAIHVTPQRQKLQRKLLQRGMGSKNAKADDAENGTAAITDANAMITRAENLLEDPSKIEALLLELGEDTTKCDSPTPRKATTKAQRKPKARQKGPPASSSSKPPPSSPSSATTPRPSATPASATTTSSSNTHSKVTKAPSEKPTESVKPVRQSKIETPRSIEVDEEEKLDEDTSEPVGFQVVENRRARRKDRKDSMPSTPDRKDSMPADRALAGQQVSGERKESVTSKPAADKQIAGQQVAPEVVKPSTPSAVASKKRNNTKNERKKSEDAAEPPTAPVASSTGTRKPAWNPPTEAIKADPRTSEAAAATTPRTPTPTKEQLGTKRTSKRWADTALDANEVGEFYTSEAEKAKKTEDVCSIQRGSEEREKKQTSDNVDGVDVILKEARRPTLTIEERQLSAAASQASADDSDYGVSDRQIEMLTPRTPRQPEDMDPARRIAMEDGVDEADGREDGCEEDGEEEADGEDWEWQCPDGYPLAECVLTEPTLCGSCGEMQPVGTKVLRAEESGWAACEDCIRVAYDQPISHQVTEEPSGAGAAAMDPSRMTTEQCVAWFKEHGSENSLRQCMQQVMTGNFYIGGYYYYAIPMTN